MFPYRVKYTESESDTTNYNSFTQTQKMPKHFRFFGNFSNKSNNIRKVKFLFCNLYKLHNSFFGFLGSCVILGFLGFSILGIYNYVLVLVFVYLVLRFRVYGLRHAVYIFLYFIGKDTWGTRGWERRLLLLLAWPREPLHCAGLSAPQRRKPGAQPLYIDKK